MEIVSHLLLTIFVPPVNRATIAIPHVFYNKMTRFVLASLFLVPRFDLSINQIQSVLFIGGPSTFLFQPYGIEIATSNHQILGAFHNKFRRDSVDVFLRFIYNNFEKVRHGLSILLRLILLHNISPFRPRIHRDNSTSDTRSPFPACQYTGFG